LCDLSLGKGREQINFCGTKSGDDVTAALKNSQVPLASASNCMRFPPATREVAIRQNARIGGNIIEARRWFHVRGKTRNAVEEFSPFERYAATISVHTLNIEKSIFDFRCQPK